jgi:hypothetical protein
VVATIQLNVASMEETVRNSTCYIQTVQNPFWFGDCLGGGGDYNTTECGFDEGDCEKLKSKYPNCTVQNPSSVGIGLCDSGDYNTTECGFDGKECESFNLLYSYCTVEDLSWVEDDWCDGDYNTAECGFDGGDCEQFNLLYPILLPYLVGNGRCNTAHYNHPNCSYDDGNCDETFTFIYPDCPGVFSQELGDCICQHSNNARLQL